MSQNRQLKVTWVDPSRQRRSRWLLGGLWLLSLIVMYVAVRYLLVPEIAPLERSLATTQDSEHSLRLALETAQTELSRERRAREVAELALEDMQQSLGQRQDEVAALRADVSFYQRLIEGGAQQPGLWIHDLRMQRDGNGAGQGGMYRYRLTLAQNLKRGKSAEGEVELAVTGSRGGQLERLDLAKLTSDTASPDMQYAFKYFQQLEGTILLPENFEPSAIQITMKPKSGGSSIRREFAWADANHKEENS
ncbi:MAG: hypothetical protein KDI37_12695 [Xanthomonadales bacterium]|nr:hypothetical protein [Xanthomonadales bacterium]MCB1642584.1 hypothetical protein [Xanthomonadales bacterium]